MRLKLSLNKNLLPLGSLALGLLIIGYTYFIDGGSVHAPVKPDGQTQTENKTEEKIQPKQDNPTEPTQPIIAENQPEPAFDKNLYSLTDPASIWMIVNKKRPLPYSYVPAGLTYTFGGQLRSEASSNLINLVNGAKQAGHNLYVVSAYRSYATQQSTYNGWVSRDGQAVADTYSARPGHSEHQTGLGVDLGNGTCDLETCFGNTQAGIWLANNSHYYGFVIRYPEGKDPITGYQYEPWHLRYVGVELAKEMAKTPNITMEEFFGIEAAPNY